jgi:hypothetical protein
MTLLRHSEVLPKLLGNGVHRRWVINQGIEGAMATIPFLSLPRKPRSSSNMWVIKRCQKLPPIYEVHFTQPPCI